MLTKKWIAQLSLTLLCVALGLMLVVQLRAQRVTQQTMHGEDWEFIVADLVDSNARLRDEIEALQIQLAGIQSTEGGGAILESLVAEVNHLRIANGLVGVSGSGVEVVIAGPISVLDLHDLINELRNAGAEALALNERRIVGWSAIGTDGDRVTVDGQPVEAPYRLRAIGDAHTLEVALVRPGGLVSLLHQAHEGISITIQESEKLTLPVYDQPFHFAYARPVE